jgi:hypothetical protein
MSLALALSPAAVLSLAPSALPSLHHVRRVLDAAAYALRDRYYAGRLGDVGLAVQVFTFDPLRDAGGALDLSDALRRTGLVDAVPALADACAVLVGLAELRHCLDSLGLVLAAGLEARDESSVRIRACLLEDGDDEIDAAYALAFVRAAR